MPLNQFIFDKKDDHRLIVQKILNSKRLLSDHVDILDECYRNLEADQEKWSLVTFPKVGSILAASLMVSFVPRNGFKYVFPVVSFICGVLCTTKTFKWIKIQRNITALTDLIKAIENFEVSVKKNMIFLNEMLHLRAITDLMKKFSSSQEVTQNCCDCIKKVIKELHSATKILETNFKIDRNYEIFYLPLESIEECDLLNDDIDGEDPKIIKDFYNIFAYIQSQFFTRVALHTVSGNEFPSKILKDLVNKMGQKSEENLKYINLITLKKEKEAKSLNLKGRTDKIPIELSNIKSFSLNFAIKLISLANEYHHLDTVIQEKVDNFHGNNEMFEQLLPSICAVDNDLKMCHEEFERIVILYKKFLNKGDAEVTSKIPENVGNENDEVEGKMYSEQDKQVFVDEFFAIDGFDVSSSGGDDDGKSENDFEELDSKLAKRYFKPVLKQLREKIVPIGEAFKEREAKVLLEKGIDLQAFDADNFKVQFSDENSADEDSETENNRRNQKMTKNRERYDDVRDFLAGKEQMNVFGLNPVASLVHEDVLE